ncbi:MAG: SH3 domain-containing protein [Clostridia bacterium]|nr:SH3 domain-containing protein [Clostridia bacterium]
MQKSRQYKRCLQALTVTAALALPMVSLADEYMMVQGGKLNLRQEPSLEAKVLGQYPTGTWMNVHEETGEWSKVTVNGKQGYVMSKFLTDGASSGTLYVKTNTGVGLNLREEPSMSGAIITSFKSGTAVKVLSRGTEWSKVQVGDAVGYMSNRFLTGSVQSGSTGSTQTKQGVVKNPGANQVLLLREKPSTDARVLGNFRNGTQVTITGESGDFYKVTVAGKSGYMMKKFISVNTASTFPTEPFTAKLINPNGNSIVNFRKAAGLSAPIIKTLPVGTEITVNEIGETWCKVTVDGVDGYISRYFFTVAH